MGSWKVSKIVAAALFFLIGLCNIDPCLAHQYFNAMPTLQVNASLASGYKIPDTLFGIFIEEINHGGAGGIWAELVSNIEV
ncbi:unnamed protein product [Rhodiola kirilowii]